MSWYEIKEYPYFAVIVYLVDIEKMIKEVEAECKSTISRLEGYVEGFRMVAIIFRQTKFYNVLYFLFKFFYLTL